MYGLVLTDDECHFQLGWEMTFVGGVDFSIWMLTYC